MSSRRGFFLMSVRDFGRTKVRPYKRRHRHGKRLPLLSYRPDTIALTGHGVTALSHPHLFHET